jgi:AraC family transcriptional regulator of adaptative response / DNA-3-methyladenine glycosylase II
VIEDFERCYRAVQSRDTRFDGWFFTAVTSTRIYCRPSCPAIIPKQQNVRFYPTAAAAQLAGFRACLRCRPDATPGSPEWLGRKDVASRAVKLVLDGIVDREGVAGLARRLGYSERQLHRVLVAEVGTGAVSLARAQRAQTARLLLETTAIPIAQVAFAAGFASVRQFNDTVKEVFARAPTELRRAVTGRRGTLRGATEPASTAAQTVTLRLAYRQPFAAEPLFEFLGLRAIPGVEAFDGTTYRRSLRLPHGNGTVEMTPADGHVMAVFSLGDLRDLTTAVARCRHLFNLDADPVAVDETLGRDPLLRPFVRSVPGRRVAGSTDGFEMAIRAVVGQQVSVAGARTVLGKLVAAAGRRLNEPRPPITHGFPAPGDLAEVAATRPEAFLMPSGRRRAVRALAEAVADGRLVIDPGADPAELEAGLLVLPGIGPWTASYVTMRALGDPDAFLPTDLGLRRAAARLGQRDDPASLVSLAESWRPWRAYALGHLWSVPTTRTTDTNTKESAA